MTSGFSECYSRRSVHSALEDWRLEMRRRALQLLDICMDATADALTGHESLALLERVCTEQDDSRLLRLLRLLHAVAIRMNHAEREELRRVAQQLLVVRKFRRQLRREASVACENTLAQLRLANGEAENLATLAREGRKYTRRLN